MLHYSCQFLVAVWRAGGFWLIVPTLGAIWPKLAGLLQQLGIKVPQIEDWHFYFTAALFMALFLAIRLTNVTMARLQCGECWKFRDVPGPALD